MDNKSKKTIKKTEKTDFNKKILKVLRCPQSKSTLIFDEVNQVLIGSKSKLVYPIINGIPIMVVKKSNSK